MSRVISGIQQVGIGVSNADEAFVWYKNIFGFDIQVFADAAEAKLMLRYTGGKPHKRYAILALNLQGGGGLEIWQYKSRTPEAAKVPFLWGRPGMMSVAVRCKDVNAFYNEVIAKNVNVITRPAQNPNGLLHFYLKDPYGNIFEVIEDDYWFTENGGLTGGICGVTIAVTDIDKAISFYSDVLELSETFFSGNARNEDWQGLAEENYTYKRGILQSRRGEQAGGFGKLLGQFFIELVEATPAIKEHQFTDRFWGDLGYIHLCFDIKGYDEHTNICKDAGYPLTIDSGDFAMGEAAGRFSYNEDPDGTLLEYVETYKVPILKKIGWYLNLRNRAADKHLPNWMVKALRFSRVK
ncbi:VOC family protein [Polluticaenibacter yanchengensis]|uniref:VOC family protein n=1 Tax=Polluticaenibacter yanchengensis TaxID=3014562 RepID=A0ABT4UMY0_9BACT|nr:VOC family protein [Chitinophagaceae bacterium LY-5]